MTTYDESLLESVSTDLGDLYLPNQGYNRTLEISVGTESVESVVGSTVHILAESSRTSDGIVGIRDSYPALSESSPAVAEQTFTFDDGEGRKEYAAASATIGSTAIQNIARIESVLASAGFSAYLDLDLALDTQDVIAWMEMYSTTGNEVNPDVPTVAQSLPSMLMAPSLMPLEAADMRNVLKRFENIVSSVTDSDAMRRIKTMSYLRNLSASSRRYEMRFAFVDYDILTPSRSMDLAKYIASGFNTVVINDLITTGRLTDTEIEYRLNRAKQIGLDVLVYMPLTGGNDLSTEAMVSRLSIYNSLNDGEILGVFFYNDCMFDLGISASNQRSWYTAIKAARLSIPVYGIIGERAVNASEGEASIVYSSDTFDHLMLQVLPYINGYLWTTTDENDMPVSHVIDAGDDTENDDLKVYIADYVEIMGTRYLNGLKKRQTVVPLVQGYYSSSAPSTRVPVPENVTTLMEYTVLELRTVRESLETISGCGVQSWGDNSASLVSISENAYLVEAVRQGNFHLRDLISCSNTACQAYHEVIVHGL